MYSQIKTILEASFIKLSNLKVARSRDGLEIKYRLLNFSKFKALQGLNRAVSLNLMHDIQGIPDFYESYNKK